VVSVDAPTASAEEARMTATNPKAPIAHLVDAFCSHYPKHTFPKADVIVALNTVLFEPRMKRTAFEGRR
jgi:hypothetical protein